MEPCKPIEWGDMWLWSMRVPRMGTIRVIDVCPPNGDLAIVMCALRMGTWRCLLLLL